MTNRFYVLTFLVVLMLAALPQAQTFSTLYNFTGGSDGANPIAGVIQDQTGNLYGTTFESGDLNCNAPNGCGVVYEVNTAGTESVVYTFSGYPSDGDGPSTPVVRDSKGNLYGTTYFGGSDNYGIVFTVDNEGKETVLYSFTGGSDGCWPDQGLAVGKSG